MKKIFLFFLLTAFLINSMGYYIIFELNKSVLKREMRLVVESNTDKYTILKICDVTRNSDFKRIDKNEILFMGNLYDVISETSSDGVTTFFCIQDVREESLLAGFKNVCKNRQLLSIDDTLIKIALPQISTGLSNEPFTVYKFPQDQFNIRPGILFPLNHPPETIS